MKALSSGPRPKPVPLDRAGAADPLGLDVLLSESNGAERVRGSRPMDWPNTARHPVAAVEAALDASPRTDAAGVAPCPCLDLRHQRPRPLVECWRKPHEPRRDHAHLDATRSREPSSRITTTGTLDLSGGIEPWDMEPDVRWSGRTGAATPPPTRCESDFDARSPPRRGGVHARRFWCLTYVHVLAALRIELA